MPSADEINHHIVNTYYGEETGVILKPESTEQNVPEWFGQYVYRLADACGLRDWRFSIMVERLPESKAGKCEPTYGRRWASIYIDQEIFDGDPDILRETVVHELMHCHFAPVGWMFNGVAKQVNLMVFDALQNHFIDAEEVMIDNIAMAFARFLPLPERPKETVQRKVK